MESNYNFRQGGQGEPHCKVHMNESYIRKNILGVRAGSVKVPKAGPRW